MAIKKAVERAVLVAEQDLENAVENAAWESMGEDL